MATVKIIPIRADLNACLEYAMNAEKTSDYSHLAAGLGYIVDGYKIAEARYVSSLNCSIANAFKEMQATKKRFGKENSKRQGYHVIQSFEPGEVEHALAHRIARELTDEVFHGYEAVIATHIDREHVLSY